MKKTLLIAAGVLTTSAILLTETVNASAQKTINVGVLQVVQHGSLDAARNGFEKELTKEVKAHNSNWTVKYNYQNAQGDQANLQSMSSQIVKGKPDLILAIATPSAQTIAKTTKSIPILTTAVTDLKRAGLVKDNNKPATNVSGTSDLTPVDKQLKLLSTLTKSEKPLGVIYNSSEENSTLQVDMAKKYAKEHHLELKIVSVTSTNDIQSALNSIDGQIAGLYVPSDNLMASAMHTIGRVTQKAKLPVVTGSIEMAEDGGTATYGLNYQDLGKQTAKMAAQIILDHKDVKQMPVEQSDKLHLYVNKSNLKKLGLKADDIKEP